MWRNGGDLHCKCQQHLKLLFLMQKLLACITKRDGRPSQSTGLTAGISQGLPSACLESRQIGMFVHSQVAKRRGCNFSSCLYQPPSSKPSKATCLYWQQCVKILPQGQGTVCSAVLCVCPGSHAHCPSPQVVTQLPPLQPALLQGPGHQLQLLGIDWL